MQKLPMTLMNRYAGLKRYAGGIFLALGACLAGFGVSPACAQDYPSRPVRIIVPFSSGGAVDGPTRVIAQELSKRLGQQVIVENKPGAGATIGTDSVAKSAPDGYTLLLASQTNAISASLYSKLPFNPIDDFAPISLIGREPGVLVIHPSLPVKTVQELIATRRSARQDRLCLVRQRQRPAPVRRHVRLDGRASR
jgi:tripartite-type tricarboxylate transporter receptor subunit TctC